MGFGYFFFNDTATTEIYTLSLHDALPILTRLFYSGKSDSPVVTKCFTENRQEHHKQGGKEWLKTMGKRSSQARFGLTCLETPITISRLPIINFEFDCRRF